MELLIIMEVLSVVEAVAVAAAASKFFRMSLYQHRLLHTYFELTLAWQQPPRSSQGAP